MFTSTKDLQPDWLHVTMYGATGTGKTEQAGSFPDPIFLMPKSDENGILTLAGSDVQFKVITSMKEMLTTLDHLEGIQHKQGEDALPGATLVFDSLSHYSDLVVEEIAKQRGGTMDMQGWGVLATHMRTLQMQARRLKMHVIYGALAETLVDDKGKPCGGRPLLAGRAKDMLPSACDIVTFLNVREGKPTTWRAHLKPHQGFYARSRFKALPQELTIGITPQATFWAQIKPLLFPAQG